MKTLNLVDINKSDIKYITSKFPDGQIVKKTTLEEIREKIKVQE